MEALGRRAGDEPTSRVWESVRWLKDRALRLKTGPGVWVWAAGQQGSMLSTSTLTRARLTPASDTLELARSPRTSTPSRRRDTAPGGGISEGSTQRATEVGLNDSSNSKRHRDVTERDMLIANAAINALRSFLFFFVTVTDWRSASLAFIFLLQFNS